jgi:serine/threonine protein kinase
MSASITNPGKYQSAQGLLDALSSKECDEKEFVRTAREGIRNDPDTGWDLLSLLDQYYRRGKIATAVFQNVKLNLERALLGAADIKDSDSAAQSGDSLSAAGLTAQTIASPAHVSGHPLTPAPPVASAADNPATTGAETVASLKNPRHEIAVGEVLRGRYQVSSVLYQGGMGTIFEAIDLYRLDLANATPRLAIKVLHNDVTQNPELLAELRREFQHLQSLSHPNIVRVHEFDRDGDTAFFTMECLSGLSLRLLLAARNQVALNRLNARSILRDVGSALAYAHHRGIVHGNLNPRNIFITDEGEVRLLNFGGSQILRRGPCTSEKDERSQVATLRYVSCQLLEGERAELSDDLYAFACVIYLLLTGKIPFGEHSAIQARTLRLRPTRPAGLTLRQWRALRSGLFFERERRPTDVDEFLESFDLQETAGHLPALLTLFKVPAKHRSRKLWLALAAAASMLLVGSWWTATNYDSVSRMSAAWSSGLLRALGDVQASLAGLWRGAAEHAVAKSGPEPIADSDHPAEAATPVTPTAVPNAAAPPSATPAPASPPNPDSHSATTEPHVTLPDERNTALRSRIELAAYSFEVPPGEPAAHVVIRRSGSLRAETSFSWWTETGTAKPGVDYEGVASHVEYISAGKNAVSLLIPVVTDSTRREPKNFYVVISDPSPNTTLGTRTVAMISIEPSL